MKAISQYSRSRDNEIDANAALKRLSATAAPSIQQQTLSVLAVMEDGREGRKKILALTQRAAQFDQLSKDVKDSELEQVRQELLRIVYDPKERMAARIGAPWLLARILLANSTTIRSGRGIGRWR